MKFKTCKKLNLVGHIHELTFSCYKNRDFLNNEEICNMIIKSIIRAKEKHHFELLAFVFMLNHVHLIIKPRSDKYSISRILQSIKQPVAREVINHVKKFAPEKLHLFATHQKHAEYRLWQDGSGFDRNITSQKALNNAIEYIHNNPVKAKLADLPKEWKWSSANHEFKDIIDMV